LTSHKITLMTRKIMKLPADGFASRAVVLSFVAGDGSPTNSPA
jgi:hypothetical protein